jgi:hypothetical protein
MPSGNYFANIKQIQTILQVRSGVEHVIHLLEMIASSSSSWSYNWHINKDKTFIILLKENKSC